MEYDLGQVDIKFKRNILNEVLTEDGRFISPKLKEMINRVNYISFKHTLNIKGVHIIIEIYKPTDYDINNINIRRILDVIGFIAYLCKLINVSFKDEVGIKIVLSPFKKVLSNQARQLTAYNVNSGFTVRDYYQGTSNIVIFREEEIVKVLIHELLHSFDIDSKTVSEVYDMEFMRMFNKETRINLNESFTESFACLLNVCLASIYHSKKDKKILKETFFKFLEDERKYILSVGEKVGKYNKLNKREQTNITAYYVIKAINWMGIEDFAKYVVRNGYMIGKYRDYVEYLGLKLNDHLKDIKNLDFTKSDHRTGVENINNMSIRMSSIDILNI